MDTCAVERCNFPISKHRGGIYCTFHNPYDKIRTYEKGEPVFIEPEDRQDEAQATVKEFIEEFSNLLKQNGKQEVNCSKFIFPNLTQEEWQKMWAPASKASEKPRKKALIKLDFPISFNDAIFGCKVDFERAEFSGTVDCCRTKFYGGVNFGYAKFGNGATFWKAQFKKFADFQNTKFDSYIYFESAKFSGVASFSFSEIKDAAKFGAVEFNKYVGFEYTHFGVDAYFAGTKFEGEVNFQRAMFGGKVDFRWVVFNDKVNFKKSLFAEICDFSHAKFHKETDFTNGFVKLLNFTQCEIFSFLRIREINKMNANERKNIEDGIKRFEDIEQAQLRKTLFEKNLEIMKVSPIFLLRDLRFWENGHLILEDSDVLRTSFWQTNFHVIRPRIDFIRVNWGDKKTILDDIYLRPEYKKKNILAENEWDLVYKPIQQIADGKRAEAIEWIYKQIRLVYETRGEYPDAGYFYLLEMNARKKKMRGFLKVLHYLYDYVSKYGESVGRAFIWFIGVWLLSTILLSFVGFEKSNEIFQLAPKLYLAYFGKTISTLVNSGVATLHSITLGRMDPYAPINAAGSAILVVARIVGLSVLTLLFLAIRRRFRR